MEQNTSFYKSLGYSPHDDFNLEHRTVIRSSPHSTFDTPAVQDGLDKVRRSLSAAFWALKSCVSVLPFIKLVVLLTARLNVSSSGQTSLQSHAHVQNMDKKKNEEQSSCTCTHLIKELGNLLCYHLLNA